MSVTQQYRFDDPIDIMYLQSAKSLKEQDGHDVPPTFAMFLVHKSMLDKEHPCFEQDTSVVFQHAGIELVKNKKEDIKQVWLNIAASDLEKNAPETWMRFEDNTKNMKCLAIHAMPLEQYNRFKIIEAEIHAKNERERKEQPLLKRIGNGLIRFIMS